MKYISLLEIADMLAEKLNFDAVTAGCINASLERTVGVYQRDAFTPRKCTGSAESSYQTAKIRILVHWTDSPTSAEKKAHEISGLLEAIDYEPVAEHMIKWSEPKGVHAIGKDEKGVCEYVVDADIFYTDKEE